MSHTLFVMLNLLVMIYFSFYFIPKNKKHKYFYVMAIVIISFFTFFHLLNVKFSLSEQLLRGFLNGLLVIALGLVTYSVKKNK